MGHLVKLSDHQNNYINQALDGFDQGIKALKNTVDAWRTGNLEKLDDIDGKPLREKYPEIYKILTTDRNDS